MVGRGEKVSIYYQGIAHNLVTRNGLINVCIILILNMVVGNHH